MEGGGKGRGGNGQEGQGGDGGPLRDKGVERGGEGQGRECYNWR